MSAYSKIASKGKLTLGLVFPLEAYEGSVAKMQEQETLAKQAEELGFKALWFRDVPFNDPSFGDAGQLYDPWIYMAHIMNHTKEIALATGSVILTLRHPIHTTKAINSIQNLSNGRLILGVASGDRPIEYPAFNQDIENKSALFRDSFFYIKALQGDFPQYTSDYFGKTNGSIDLLPKSKVNTPILITGHSGQSLEWIAEHSDGWIYYPRNIDTLKVTMQRWYFELSKTNTDWKPFIQSLYVDLTKNDGVKPSPIHLGFRSSAEYLISYLKILESNGVNHVILNLKYGTRSAREMIEEIGKNIIPHFN